MPDIPRDPDQAVRHDHHPTAELEAWFQGSRVRLHVKADAAAQLRDALDRIARSEPTGPAALARPGHAAARRPGRCACRSG